MSLVLVADDEPAVLEVLSEVVEDLGHDVLRARDGREALALAKVQPPALVVTDHMMPQLTGLDLCRQLRLDERLREVPVILLSAALPHGFPEADTFLPKPFELSDFERLVQQTLKQRGGEDASPRAVPIADADHLVHSVAHELKTPLAAARLNLELLERGIAQKVSSADRGHLAALAEQLASVEAMVHGLVAASRLSDGAVPLARRQIDLGELATQVASGWQEEHPETELQIETLPGDLGVRVDPERIAEVVRTLLVTAIRFGSPRRRLGLSVLPGPGSVTLRLAELNPPDGVPSDVSGGSFASPGGQGVALYLASQVARLHGGALTVRSTHGEGAQFTLRLPRGR